MLTAHLTAKHPPKKAAFSLLPPPLAKRNTTLKSLKTRLRNTQQKVDDIKDVDTLVNPATYDDNLIAIVNTLKGTSEDTFFDRKNKLLDFITSK